MENMFLKLPVPVLLGFPVTAAAVLKAVSSLGDQETAGFTMDTHVEDLKSLISEEEYSSLIESLDQIMAEYTAATKREEAEFGVEVDHSDPRNNWSNADEAIQEACVERIEQIYKGAKGNIVFYGPSNLAMWYSLETDMLPYKAENHGIGGCIDPEMIRWAPRLLYASEPSVVFFQTGSNDLANGLSLEQILQNKKEMYGLFLKNMPHTKLVVMSGLPLPNRQQFWADTVKTNDLLRTMCEETDRMYFMDATDQMLSASGPENMATPTGDGRFFTPEYYRIDGIHLNKKGHDVWTACMKAKLKEMGIEA